MFLFLSLVSQSSSQAETLSHNLQNGQKLPPMSAKTSTPLKKQQEPTADSNKPSRPAGDRRCVKWVWERPSVFKEEVCQSRVQSLLYFTSICLLFTSTLEQTCINHTEGLCPYIKTKIKNVTAPELTFFITADNILKWQIPSFNMMKFYFILFFFTTLILNSVSFPHVTCFVW